MGVRVAEKERHDAAHDRGRRVRACDDDQGRVCNGGRQLRLIGARI